MHRFTAQRVCNPYCGHAMLSWILRIAFISWWSGNNFLCMQIHEKFHYRTGGTVWSLKSAQTICMSFWPSQNVTLCGNTTQTNYTTTWCWQETETDYTFLISAVLSGQTNSGVVQETIVGHVHIHILQVHMYHYTTYSLCARALQQLPVSSS